MPAPDSRQHSLWQIAVSCLGCYEGLRFWRVSLVAVMLRNPPTLLRAALSKADLVRTMHALCVHFFLASRGPVSRVQDRRENQPTISDPVQVTCRATITSNFSKCCNYAMGRPMSAEAQGASILNETLGSPWSLHVKGSRRCELSCYGVPEHSELATPSSSPSRNQREQLVAAALRPDKCIFVPMQLLRLQWGAHCDCKVVLLVAMAVALTASLYLCHGGSPRWAQSHFVAN